MEGEKSTFLTGEEADQRLREVLGGGETAEAAVAANRALDAVLETMGISPATMEKTGSEGDK